MWQVDFQCIFIIETHETGSPCDKWNQQQKWKPLISNQCHRRQSHKLSPLYLLSVPSLLHINYSNRSHLDRYIPISTANPFRLLVDKESQPSNSIDGCAISSHAQLRCNERKVHRKQWFVLSGSHCSQCSHCKIKSDISEWLIRSTIELSWIAKKSLFVKTLGQVFKLDLALRPSNAPFCVF